ncbi:MAG: hypothetical protein DMG11_34100, partial [Acidobacteria bacterium]
VCNACVLCVLCVQCVSKVWKLRKHGGLESSSPPSGINPVELNFVRSLSIEETAEVVGVSPGTVRRDWTLAKAWLQREINATDTPSGRLRS